MRPFTALLCACCALRTVAAVQYSVDCLQFYAALVVYVDCGGECPEMQSAADCASSGLVQKMLLYEASIAIRNTTVVFDMQGDPAALSRLLVFAAIGRHFARQPGVKTPHFRWDSYDEALVLDQLSCEFQRPLYAFILIVTLVFVVVFVGMHVTVSSSQSTAHAKDAAASRASTVYTATGSSTAGHALSGTSTAVSFRGATRTTQL
jgi:hypothetical protein